MPYFCQFILNLYLLPTHIFGSHFIFLFKISHFLQILPLSLFSIRTSGVVPVFLGAYIHLNFYFSLSFLLDFLYFTLPTIPTLIIIPRIVIIPFHFFFLVLRVTTQNFSNVHSAIIGIRVNYTFHHLIPLLHIFSVFLPSTSRSSLSHPFASLVYNPHPISQDLPIRPRRFAGGATVAASVHKYADVVLNTRAAVASAHGGADAQLRMDVMPSALVGLDASVCFRLDDDANHDVMFDTGRIL